MKNLIAGLVVSLMPVVTTAAPKWEIIGRTDQATFEYLYGSFVPKHDQNNEWFWTLQMRMSNNVPNTSYEFRRMAVSFSDCERGTGQLLWINTRDVVDNRSDFIFSGGTVASNIAEFICAVGVEYRKRMDSEVAKKPGVRL